MSAKSAFATVVFLCVICLIQRGFTQERDAESTDDERAELDTLAVLLDSVLSDSRVVFVDSVRRATVFESVKALATGLLYVRDSAKYHEAFFNTFSIHDHEARHKGQYNFIDEAEMMSAAAAAQSRFNHLKAGKVLLLLLYLDAREKNWWLQSEPENVSVARFYRTGFLAVLTINTNLDAVRLANELDDYAYKKRRETQVSE